MWLLGLQSIHMSLYRTPAATVTFEEMHVISLLSLLTRLSFLLQLSERMATPSATQFWPLPSWARRRVTV